MVNNVEDNTDRLMEVKELSGLLSCSKPAMDADGVTVAPELATTSQTLEAAQDYIGRRWAVLPICGCRDGRCDCGKAGCNSPGKHPRLGNGVKGASRDPDVIMQWFGHSTQCTDNIGIAAGQSNLVVIDVDVKNGVDGFASLQAMTTQVGNLPETVTASTPTGGMHYYYAVAEPVLKGVVGVLGYPGVDIRCHGGYVVAPPSRRNGSHYEWTAGHAPGEIALAELPDVWFEALPKINEPKATPQTTNSGHGMVGEGGRNAYLTSIAGTLRKQGHDYDLILKNLLDINKNSCERPLADAEVDGIARSVARYEPGQPDQIVAGKGKGKGQSDLLLKLCEHLEVFRTPDPDREGYALLEKDGHTETYAIQSEAFGSWLRHQFFMQTGTAAKNTALEEVVDTIKARALFGNHIEPVYLRTGRHEDTYWLDLANDRWQAVKVTPNGWDVVDNPPVRFRRAGGMMALPVPVRDGNYRLLWDIVNLGTRPEHEPQKLLALVWELWAMLPIGDYPLLSVNGGQGSGKSFSTEVLRRVIDPNDTPLATVPQSERDLMVQAFNNNIVGFDNLSSVAPWLSDALCRIATGAGFSCRKLYENNAELRIRVKRPIIMNGIGDIADRGDLLQRCLLVQAPLLDESAYIRKDDLEAQFRQQHPAILGGLLDVLVAALRVQSTIKDAKLTRMADFHHFGLAVEKVLELPDGTFDAAYQSSRHVASATAIDSSSVSQVILKFVERRQDVAYGAKEFTALELLQELEATDRWGDGRYTTKELRARPDWPKNPKGLANALRRLSPSFRDVHGIVIEQSPVMRGNAYKWTIRRADPEAALGASTAAVITALTELQHPA